MTFDPTPYAAVVINEFRADSPIFDDQGNFICLMYFKTENISKWAGKVAHGFKIEIGYDDLHIDGSPYGTYVDGLEERSLSVRVPYIDDIGDPAETRLFDYDDLSMTSTALPEPYPMFYDVSLRYGADSEFPPGTNNYRFYMVLNTPTVMPAAEIITTRAIIPSTFGLYQTVDAGYGVTPTQIQEYPNWRFAYRITVYVENSEIPPLRLINRDDNTGKRPSPRITQVNTRNNGTSLQAQRSNRVGNSANVWW